MIKKYLLLWTLTFLTACSTLPNIEALPEVKEDSRTFKVEQLAEQQVKQTSLLTVQFQPEQWRWVQTDPLGSPIARLLLTKQGWKNDGFVMPNKQAQGLFLALATAFTEQQPDAKHLILMWMYRINKTRRFTSKMVVFYGTFGNNQINILFS